MPHPVITSPAESKCTNLWRELLSCTGSAPGEMLHQGSRKVRHTANSKYLNNHTTDNYEPWVQTNGCKNASKPAKILVVTGLSIVLVTSNLNEICLG